MYDTRPTTSQGETIIYIIIESMQDGHSLVR